MVRMANLSVSTQLPNRALNASTNLGINEPLLPAQKMSRGSRFVSGFKRALGLKQRANGPSENTSLSSSTAQLSAPCNPIQNSGNQLNPAREMSVEECAKTGQIHVESFGAYLEKLESHLAMQAQRADIRWSADLYKSEHK